MIRKFTPLLFSAGLLSILFLIFWQASPGPRLTQISQQMEVDMNILGFYMIQGAKGKPNWELISDSADFLEKENTFMLDDPLIIYHTENNSGSLTITASQGMARQGENTIHLWPDVTARQDGIEVKAGRATYMGGDNHIFLEDEVIFSRHDMIITSSQARIIPDQNRIEAMGSVKTRLR